MPENDSFESHYNSLQSSIRLQISGSHTIKLGQSLASDFKNLISNLMVLGSGFKRGHILKGAICLPIRDPVVQPASMAWSHQPRSGTDIYNCEV
jgi:hypothetical protein